MGLDTRTEIFATVAVHGAVRTLPAKTLCLDATLGVGHCGTPSTIYTNSQATSFQSRTQSHTIHTQTQVPLTAPSHRKTLSLSPVPAHHHSVSTGHCLPLNTTNTTNTTTPTTPAPHNHTHQPTPQLHRPSTLAAAVTPTVRICSHGSHDGSSSAARRELLPHRLADTVGGSSFVVRSVAWTRPFRPGRPRDVEDVVR